jgi:hypothetical protein
LVLIPSFNKVSLDSKLTSLTKTKEAKGSIRIINIEIDNQILLHSIIVNKKTTNSGRINSAKDKPNQVVLKALPLLFSKYREIVVVVVCDINPCPDSLIKNIEKNKKTIDEILENRKQEIANKIITYAANFNIFTSSIFLPIQTNIKLLNNVADA